MPTPLDTTRKYRLSSELMLKEVDDELLAFAPEALAVHEFNASLASVARMCDGEHTCEQMVVELSECFGLQLEEAATEVYRALRILRDEHLLEG